MAIQTPIKYNSTNKKHELFAPTDTIPASVIPSETIVDFSVNADPNTGGTTFSPNTPATADIIYTSTINNSTWVWNGSSYVTYTPPNKTEWNLAGTTNDAGGNKTSAIWRTAGITIGSQTEIGSPVSVVTTGGTVFSGTRYINSPNSSGIALRKARGTEAAPSGVLAGDVLTSIVTSGHDGTAFGVGSSLRSAATENWTTSAHGSEFTVNVTPRGQISSTVNPFRVDENGLSISKFGSVSTGVTPSPTEALDIYGNVKFSQALMPNNQAGTAGQVLTSSGSGIAPVWQKLAVVNFGKTAEEWRDPPVITQNVNGINPTTGPLLENSPIASMTVSNTYGYDMTLIVSMYFTYKLIITESSANTTIYALGVPMTDFGSGTFSSHDPFYATMVGLLCRGILPSTSFPPQNRYWYKAENYVSLPAGQSKTIRTRLDCQLVNWTYPLTYAGAQNGIDDIGTWFSVIGVPS